MNNIGIHTFSRLKDEQLHSHFFVEGIHGNFLLGDTSVLEASDFDFLKAKGGVNKVINLGELIKSPMDKIFSLFGASQVRVDDVKCADFPCERFGQDYVNPSIRLLHGHKIAHLLIKQRDRYVLFLDPQIRLVNHQLASPIDKNHLTQSLLPVIEKVDFLAAFGSLAGGAFFPLLPGLLAKKIEQMTPL